MPTNETMPDEATDGSQAATQAAVGNGPLEGADAAQPPPTTTSKCPSHASFDRLDVSSFGYYDALYDRAASEGFASSRRVGSVEVIPRPNDADGRTYAVVRFITIGALSARQNGTGGDGEVLVPRGSGGAQAYGDLAGIMLAAHHFNNGIGNVVRDLDGIDGRCPVRFALDDVRDSESDPIVAARHFNDALVAADPSRPPGGLFGGWRSAVSEPLAVLGGAYKIPQVSPLSTSPELDDKGRYPYFGRLIPSDAVAARGFVDYLTRPGSNVRHLGMLYVNDSYGSNFHQAIVKASLARPKGDRVAVKGRPFSYVAGDSVADVEAQVERLAATGYRYFFGAFHEEHYELVMGLAHKHGIAGPGYTWILGDSVSETFWDDKATRADYADGSPLAIASRGVGILQAEGGRSRKGDGDKWGYDRLQRAWNEQGEENVDYYNCKQPKNNTMGDPSIYFRGPSGYFADEPLALTAGAVFNYDSAVALGLAACKLYNETGEDYFDGEDLFDKFVSQSFEGASGRVVIDPKTSTRDPGSAFFVLYNARQGPDGEGGIAYSVVRAAWTVPNNDAESSAILWTGADDEAYVYSDGTTTTPDSLPPLDADFNRLSAATRVVGLFVAALIIALAVFFGVWTKRNRRERVIKASQPEFLYMICVGAAVLGSTLIPLSMDDGVLSQAGCDKACMLIPWLYQYGFTIVFSALFAKTWRLNKIMANAAIRRKMRVKKRDATKPFFLLLILYTVMLVIWTEVDPIKWVRTDTGAVDEFGRSVESGGFCSSGWVKDTLYGNLFGLVNIVFLCMGNYQVYRARGLSTEFSESKYIAMIMWTIFQTMVFQTMVYAGALHIVVGNTATAYFIVHILMIGAMGLTSLCLIFVPKMAATWSREEDESDVVRATITEVPADVDDEAGEEEGGGILMSIWDGAKGWIIDPNARNSAGGSDAANNAGGRSNGDIVMTGRSIFVGTLAQGDEHI